MERKLSSVSKKVCFNGKTNHGQGRVYSARPIVNACFYFKIVSTVKVQSRSKTYQTDEERIRFFFFVEKRVEKLTFIIVFFFKTRVKNYTINQNAKGRSQRMSAPLLAAQTCGIVINGR